MSGCLQSYSLATLANLSYPQLPPSATLCLATLLGKLLPSSTVFLCFTRFKRKENEKDANRKDNNNKFIRFAERNYSGTCL